MIKTNHKSREGWRQAGKGYEGILVRRLGYKGVHIFQHSSNVLMILFYVNFTQKYKQNDDIHVEVFRTEVY